MNGMIHNQKLVSKSQICHYHAYRRYNMTICKQFDNVRWIIINSVSAFTGRAAMMMQWIPFTGIIHPQKSLSVVNVCQLCSYRMWNMTIRKQFDGVQGSFESFLCQKAMHRGCMIWQSQSNLMHYEMLWSPFRVIPSWRANTGTTTNFINIKKYNKVLTHRTLYPLLIM
jgi:hypothetical protein